MNRCRYCRCSLEMEIESDVLLNGGLCSECADEERADRRALIDDDDEDYDADVAACEAGDCVDPGCACQEDL